MFDYKPEIKDSFRVAIIGLGYVGLVKNNRKVSQILF